MTSNVPSMWNGIPARKLLERVYVEGADVIRIDDIGLMLEGVATLRFTH